MEKNEKGLTLIETLVAISILMVAIAGALTLAQRSLASSSYAKDEVVALYLAQEGMELVHNRRDANFIRAVSWLTGLGSCQSGKCYMDATTSSVVACGATCPVLRMNSTSGLYGYSASWTPTKYRREIRITPVSNEERLVTVTVTWTSGTISRKYEIKETILNWYEGS